MKKNTKKKTKQTQLDELKPLSRTTKIIQIEKEIEEVSANFSLELVALYLHQKFSEIIPEDANIEPIHSKDDPEVMVGVRVWWHEKIEEEEK